MTPLSDSSYCEIPLSQGMVALVDKSDYESLSQWNWYAVKAPNQRGFYAVRHEDRSRDASRTTIKMHRQILGLGKGDPRKGDHIDPNRTLDNRRSNLRIATCAENTWNQVRRKNNTSGFKGVSFRKQDRLWTARIGFKGTRQFLGYFKTAESAYAAYTRAAHELHGEFARVA